MSSQSSQREVHWGRTRNLMIVHMVIWFIFSYVVHWWATELNAIRLMNFPLGFWFASQGSLVAFVVQLFIFSWQQHRIDVECGMAEDQ